MGQRWCLAPNTLQSTGGAALISCFQQPGNASSQSKAALPSLQALSLPSRPFPPSLISTQPMNFLWVLPTLLGAPALAPFPVCAPSIPSSLGLSRRQSPQIPGAAGDILMDSTPQHPSPLHHSSSLIPKLPLFPRDTKAPSSPSHPSFPNSPPLNSPNPLFSMWLFIFFPPLLPTPLPIYFIILFFFFNLSFSFNFQGHHGQTMPPVPV